MSTLRKDIIQKLITVIEKIHFYPKLKVYYKNNLKQDHLTVIDVGAHKGQSIDFFLSLNKKVKIYSFEPNKKLFEVLKLKYQNKNNIHLINKGISSKNDFLVFHENILDETSTFEEINSNSKYLEKKARILGVKKENIFIDHYKVEVIKLSDFISGINGKIDFLKIDVEGHEYDCLEGLFQSNNCLDIRYIQIEKHQDDMYQSAQDFYKINSLLEKNGYFQKHEIKHAFGNFYEVIYEHNNIK